MTTRQLLSNTLINKGQTTKAEELGDRVPRFQPGWKCCQPGSRNQVQALKAHWIAAAV